MRGKSKWLTLFLFITLIVVGITVIGLNSSYGDEPKWSKISDFGSYMVWLNNNSILLAPNEAKWGFTLPPEYSIDITDENREAVPVPSKEGDLPIGDENSKPSVEELMKGYKLTFHSNSFNAVEVAITKKEIPIPGREDVLPFRQINNQLFMQNVINVSDGFIVQDGGNQNLWHVDFSGQVKALLPETVDGKNQEELYSMSEYEIIWASSPLLHPSGQTIFYTSNRISLPDAFRMDIWSYDLITNENRLIFSNKKFPQLSLIDWSSDGKIVARSEGDIITIEPESGRMASLLQKTEVSSVTFNSKGKYLAYIPAEGDYLGRDIWTYNIETDESKKVFEIPETAHYNGFPGWVSEEQVAIFISSRSIGQEKSKYDLLVIDVITGEAKIIEPPQGYSWDTRRGIEFIKDHHVVAVLRDDSLIDSPETRSTWLIDFQASLARRDTK